MSIFLNLEGKRFGRLLVIRKLGSETRYGKKVSTWITRCECGNEKKVLGKDLTQGAVKSCGCLLRSRLPETPAGKAYCTACKATKAESEFWKLRGGSTRRVQYVCKTCRKGKQDTSGFRSARRRWERRVRREVLDHYGGKCVCCDEDGLEFLTIDRIDTGKRRRRSRIPRPWLLKKKGFPKGFRVLCHNCDTSNIRYGYCPHAHAEQIDFVEGTGAVWDF